MKDYIKRMILLILIGLVLVYWMTGASSSGFFTDLEDLITNFYITIIIITLALVIGRYENKHSWKKITCYFVLPMLVVTFLAYPVINGNNVSHWHNRYKIKQIEKLFSIQLLERTNLIDAESYTFAQYYLTTDKKFIAFREGDNIIVRSRNEITDSFKLTDDVVIYLSQREYYKPQYSLVFKSFGGDYIRIGDKGLKISEEGKFAPID